MKKKDVQALVTKTPAELREQLSQVQQQLGLVRLQKKVGKLSDTSLPSKLADDIARIKGALTQTARTQQAESKA